ncbi:MAG TPA: SCO family protein [Pyrinomonadaceae bacterium]
MKKALATSLALIFAFAVAQRGLAQTARREAQQQPARAEQATDDYTCPMHPRVKSKLPGKCPHCGMNLARGGAGAVPSDPARDAADERAALQAMKIPDVSVVDQDGRKLRFHTDLVRGKTVAINFIFTTCVTVCPPLAATFRRVQQTLGPRASDVQLISVSVDPVTDTPERMKAFLAKFKAAPGWSFVSGEKHDIDALLKALGAFTADKNDHTPMLLVGNDAAGHWTRTYGLAKPSEIIKVIDEVAPRASDARPALPAGAAAAPRPASFVPAAFTRSRFDEGRTEASLAAEKYFTNTVLVTQDGRPVRFYEDVLKDKVVLVDFIYTTCRGICPPMTANFLKVQKYLGERAGKDILLVTISVDPVNDTPAAMKAYAEKFKAGPGWLFLTGRKENVDWVLYKLGSYVERPEEHTDMIVVGSEATGEWMKMRLLSVKASEIADAAVRLADQLKAAKAPRPQ